jgi:hypothetical protein
MVTAKKAADTLVWKDCGVGSMGGNHNYEAPAARGIYVVRAADAFPSGKFSHYDVEHIENPRAPYRDQKRRTFGAAPTAEKAKAIAQDHSGGGEGG